MKIFMLFLALLVLSGCLADEAPQLPSEALEGSKFDLMPANWMHSEIRTNNDYRSEITYTRSFSSGTPRFASAYVDLALYSNEEDASEAYRRFEDNVFYDRIGFGTTWYLPDQLIINSVHADQYRVDCTEVDRNVETVTGCNFWAQYGRCNLLFVAHISPLDEQTYDTYSQIIEENISAWIETVDYCNYEGA
ncbi:MAG: hypothetical protein RLP44_13315 [Aggregatilineales bacterium]